MSTLWQVISRRFGSFPLAVGLMITTVAINLVGVISIMSARRSALDQAVRDLELETVSRAHAVEASLAGCRADLLFLAGSPPLAGLPAALSQTDPYRVRWRRLDAEGSLLLFLQSHPEVSRLVVFGPEHAPVLVAGRREGAPVMLPPSSIRGQGGVAAGAGVAAGVRATAPSALAPAPVPGTLVGAWTLAGGGGALQAEVDAGALLAAEVAAQPDLVLLDADGGALAGSAPAGPGVVSVSAPLHDEGWSPPVRWSLVRRLEEQRLVSSVSQLASRYRINLLLNLAVMTLAILLGLAGLREAQRTARLEEQAAQQSHVRELERQLFHSERLSTVGRLAAGLAHEVNNPLEGMINYLKLVEEDLTAGRAEEAREALPRLKEGLERAAGIIRQVLQFSNPSRAPMGPVDLAAVLAETVQFVRGNREFRGIEFVADVAEGIPPVTGNRLLLGQLFLNLLLNACQAQPGGGTVEVTAERVGEGRLLARVADRGPGVPEADRERIFEPFYSSRHSTGLGLSVCQRIAEQHGSALRLNNRPGGGAEFSLELKTA